MSVDREREYEILRGLSVDHKLKVMGGLIQQAIDLKVAWVRATEPELEDDEVRTKAKEVVAGGRT
jgi:hypothetical protein